MTVNVGYGKLATAPHVSCQLGKLRVQYLNSNRKSSPVINKLYK